MSEQLIFVQGWLPPRGLEALRGLIATLYRLLTRLEVRGTENLPGTGGFIVCTNHLSHFDAPLIFILLKGYKVAVFAADKYRSHPFFRPILEAVDCIWVHRGAIGPSTIKAAIRVLRSGRVLGMAPEGTRSRVTHALQEGKTGAAFLAISAGVPMVPVALANTDQMLSAFQRLKRPHVIATIGKPFTLEVPPKGQRPDARILQASTDEIMCRIAAMLPPKYRGVYADHPRLKELLAERSVTSDGAERT
jgi:1-acyl-sn-glycerol-3-phosphate acyltransferase